MTKLDRTLPANKSDKVLIKKGESYYWWQFMNRPVQYSKTKPRRSQLTQSEFYSWLYDFEDDTIGSFTLPDADEELLTYSPDDLKATRDEWVNEINNMAEELQSRLDNMPEGLQDSSVLPERISALEDWAADLENVDLDWDDEELKDEAEQAHSSIREEMLPSKLQAKIQATFLELKREKLDELLMELQNTSISI